MQTNGNGSHMVESKKQQASADHIGGSWSSCACGLTDVPISACEEGPGICSHLISVFSLFLIAASLPLSLFFVIKVVQVNQKSTVKLKS